MLATGTAAILSVAIGAGSGPRDLFYVDGKRPDRIVITVNPELDLSRVMNTPMTDAMFGVVADLPRSSVSRVIGSVALDDPDPPVEPVEVIGVMHLLSERTSEQAQLELIRSGDGRYLARGADGAAELRTRIFEPLIADRPRFFGPFDAPADLPPGSLIELPRPYLASTITMDNETMRSRLYRGMRVVELQADRLLASERMHVRLPADYDAKLPAGLLVWASPTPDGRIPVVFGPALDAMGIICIGIDEAGNARDVPDKFQLMFDAVATGLSRFHVDPKRVYMAGMSGGGKVASILTICFPEVFCGGVSIVGLGTQNRLDARTFGDHAMAYFTPPRGEDLDRARTRPIAAMTGPLDFNFAEVQARVAALLEEGFHARLFSFDDMGHVMPTPHRFTEALRWVDRRHELERGDAWGAADMLLAAYFEDRDDPKPRSQADRAALLDVIRAGPWSPSSWRALELLGLTP